MVLSVLDDIIFWKGGDVQTHLLAVQSAPNQAHPVGSSGDRVMGTTGDGGNAVVEEVERRNFDRVKDDGSVAAGALSNRGFTEVVEAPGPSVVVTVDCEGVIMPAADKSNRLFDTKP